MEYTVASVTIGDKQTITAEKFIDLSTGTAGGIPVYGKTLTASPLVDVKSSSAELTVSRFGVSKIFGTNAALTVALSSATALPSGEIYAGNFIPYSGNASLGGLYGKAVGTASTNKAIRADCGSNEIFYVTNALTRVANALSLGGAVTLASFTVATLPSAAVAGQVAYASNGRVGVELAAAGTGCPVFSKAGVWMRFDTNTQVQA